MNHIAKTILTVLLSQVFLFSCADTPTSPDDPGTPPPPTGEADTVSTYGFRIINEYPHDENAFTQGLVFADGMLYEGTGRNGESSVRKVELETGTVLQKTDLAREFFGEGITIFDDRIIQLTWFSRTGFIYDLNTFEPLRSFSYPTQGWGITHDGERLIMSDGSHRLYFHDPQTFERIGEIEVSDGERTVDELNELEFIDGEVYANVWLTDRIVRIDPATGQVTGWIDLTGLLRAEDRNEFTNVLNGIAYDGENDRLFVTGKLWPKLFEVELVPEE